ncbi:hypothetical protein [Lichenibacterium ramalinae]|nr:hypothetical protein [Lichenibacterium ramalinae]
MRMGDSVRLKAGSELWDLFEPWADLTGRVAGVYADGAMIAVDYPPPFEAYTSAVPAAEFRHDPAPDDAPF